MQTFKENTDNLYATKTTVDELSADVAYINVEDNENVESPDIEMADITIDSALSETSTNPVQNKVVTAELNQLSETIDDLSTYVTPEMFGAVGDGVTDDTEAINTTVSEHTNVVFGKNYLVSNTITLQST